MIDIQVRKTAKYSTTLRQEFESGKSIFRRCVVKFLNGYSPDDIWNDENMEAMDGARLARQLDSLLRPFGSDLPRRYEQTPALDILKNVQCLVLENFEFQTI